MGLLNPENTNFPNGLTNRNASDIFGSMGQLDPTKFVTVMDDFLTYDSNDYAITGAGTIAIAGEPGGSITMTTQAVDDDSLILLGQEYNVGTPTGVGAYFATRLRLGTAEVVQSDLFVGLVGDGTSVTDPGAGSGGIYFAKADGSADLSFNVDTGSGIVTVSGIHTMVNQQYVTLAAFADGQGRVYYSVNGTTQGYLDATPLADNQTIGVGLQAGEAAAKRIECDYLFTAFERE